MRSKNEIYKEVINLSIETKELKEFMEALKNEDTLHPTRKFTSVFVEKKTSLFFTSLFLNEKKTSFPIPARMRIEIYVLCQKWLKELENRSEELKKEYLFDSEE